MAKRPTARKKTDAAAAPAAPKPRRPRTTASKPASAPGPSVDEIRRRAYERYLERGGTHGRHDDDWIAAEAELRKKK